MKRLLFVFLIAIIAFPALQSCKKGANDPGLSFASRNARITAKWKLKKIEGTATYVNSGTTNNVTIAYDGSVGTSTSSLYGSQTATGSYEMTIEKKGYMSWNETFTTGTPSVTDVQSESGSWQWLDTDKNKLFVILIGGNHFFTGGACRIDRLAGKELVIIDENSENDNGDTGVWNIKYTFEKL